MGNHAELATLSAVELLARYRRRELSPVEVTHAVLEAVARHDPQLNAFALLTADEALESARASEARWQRGEPCGAVDGVPATIKDILAMRGHPTRKASHTLSDAPPDAADAPCTRNLRRNGAVLIGKTTSPEFGWKAVTDSPALGITRNPWNPELTPGGSSGGAAAAAATGMGALHVGTDGGGSIRIPASFTATFGIKPTFGRVPAHPASVFGELAHIGPMTRTVADAELMLGVLCGHDSRDGFAIPPTMLPQAPPHEARWRSLRVGYVRDLPGTPVDPAVAAVIDAAVRRIEALGAVVEPLSLADLDTRETFRTLWWAGAGHLARHFPAADMARLDPGFRAIVEEARGLTLDDYLDALAHRRWIAQRLKAVHDDCDVLVSTAVAVPPPAAGEELSEPATQQRWIDWAGYSYPFNLSQQPAASVPCGFTPDGDPVGLQVAGPRFSDYHLLDLCAELEAVFGVTLPSRPG